MKRCEALRHADMAPGVFDILRRQGQLPFNPPADADGYTDEQADALKLLSGLLKWGMRPGAACELIEMDQQGAIRVLTILRGRFGAALREVEAGETIPKFALHSLGDPLLDHDA